MTAAPARSRSPWVHALVAAVLAVAGAPLPVKGAPVEPSSPEVIDLHVDLPYRVGYGRGSYARGSGQVVAADLRAAGVGGVVLPLFVPRQASPEGPRARDLEASFVRLGELFSHVPPYAPPGCSAPPGSVRTWLSFEGAAPLAADPDAISRWVGRGARIFGLVHTWANALAASSGDRVQRDLGLTDLGRDFVRRVHAGGGIVDVSHASDAATDELIGLAAAAGLPIVATHSDARAVTLHPRNLTDDQIRAVARTGGVVGVNFHSRFLSGRRRARLSDVVRHVTHLVRVAGEEHVAIGSDFEGDIRPPIGLEGVRGFPRLARALREAGLPEETIARVFGANALRLLCPSDRPRPRPDAAPAEK